MKRAVVTGASGFVGRSLVAQLRMQGWDLRFLGRRADQGPHGLAPDWSTQSLRPALAAFRPDYIFHLAGRTQAKAAQEFYAANLLPAAQLLDGLEDLPERPVVVLVGSAAEYGEAPEAAMPVPETHHCAPVSDYGASKLAQTELGLSRARRGWPIVVARLFNPVGPGMPEHLALGSFAARLASGVTSLQVGNLDVRRDFIAVDEAARLIVEVGQSPQALGQVVNICSGHAYLLRELVERMVMLVNQPTVIEPVASRMRPGEMTTFVGCTHRLEALGLAPAAPDFDALLPQMLEAAR
ncbi:NAD-dependent epimerase/dehydratase family protein [Phenylobacterium sp.]|uniref:NAD-dependent epimerase/dehydratase family protein n=1 Tax=Phenylobacterium sp. TaxID=1871053 RepID=UPI0025FD3EEB|nr:NAD-dependent epimerase/dehydratase family protein [Phenylobacterium sp.]